MSEVGKAALVWSPFPDAEIARKIGGQLIGEKLIACANIFPAIESVFEWKGKVSSETECAVLLKTTAEHLDAVTKRLADLHPYETPAIVGWLVDKTPLQTLQWLEETLK